MLPKVIYRFSAIPSKISMAFIHRNIKINLKIHMEPQKTLNRQSNLEQNEQSWRHHSDYKIYTNLQ